MTDPVLVPRRMDSADWPAVEAGYAHSFLDCRAGEIWDWRFFRHGKTLPERWYATVAATSDGRIAAFVAGSCHSAWIRGCATTIVICRDNYTDPAFRGVASGRNGLFARTTRMFFDSMSDSVAACVGFANERSLQLTARLGINKTYVSGSWYIWKFVPKANSGITCIAVPCDFASDETRDQWDHLWERRKSVQRAGLVRNQEFLGWRFSPQQGREYWSFALRSLILPEPLGYIVLTPSGKGAAILVDAVLPTQPQLVQDAWGQITAWLSRRGILSVRTFMGAACPEVVLLPYMGFQPAESTLPTLPGFRVYPSWPDDMEFERDYAFTLADSDLF